MSSMQHTIYVNGSSYLVPVDFVNALKDTYTNCRWEQGGNMTHGTMLHYTLDYHEYDFNRFMSVLAIKPSTQNHYYAMQDVPMHELLCMVKFILRHCTNETIAGSINKKQTRTVINIQAILRNLSLRLESMSKYYRDVILFNIDHLGQIRTSMHELNSRIAEIHVKLPPHATSINKDNMAHEAINLLSLLYYEYSSTMVRVRLIYNIDPVHISDLPYYLESLRWGYYAVHSATWEDML